MSDEETNQTPPPPQEEDSHNTPAAQDEQPVNGEEEASPAAAEGTDDTAPVNKTDEEQEAEGQDEKPAAEGEEGEEEKKEEGEDAGAAEEEDNAPSPMKSEKSLRMEESRPALLEDPGDQGDSVYCPGDLRAALAKEGEDADGDAKPQVIAGDEEGEEFIQTSDGQKLRFFKGGQGKELILCVAGHLPTDPWTAFAELDLEKYTIVSYHQRGAGKSSRNFDKPAEDAEHADSLAALNKAYGIQRQIQDLEEVRQVFAPEYDKIHLAGHAFGSVYVALYLAEFGNTTGVASVILASPSDQLVAPAPADAFAVFRNNCAEGEEAAYAQFVEENMSVFQNVFDYTEAELVSELSVPFLKWAFNSLRNQAKTVGLAAEGEEGFVPLPAEGAENDDYLGGYGRAGVLTSMGNTRNYPPLMLESIKGFSGDFPVGQLPPVAIPNRFPKKDEGGEEEEEENTKKENGGDDFDDCDVERKNDDGEQEEGEKKADDAEETKGEEEAQKDEEEASPAVTEEEKPRPVNKKLPPIVVLDAEKDMYGTNGSEVVLRLFQDAGANIEHVVFPNRGHWGLLTESPAVTWAIDCFLSGEDPNTPLPNYQGDSNYAPGMLQAALEEKPAAAGKLAEDESTITTSDGEKLKLFKAGSGSELIICVHGAGLSTASVWKAFADLDKERFTVILFQQRGNGDLVEASSVPAIATTYGVQRQLQDIEEVRLAFGEKYEKVHFAGHDFGAVLLGLYISEFGSSTNVDSFSLIDPLASLGSPFSFTAPWTANVPPEYEGVDPLPNPEDVVGGKMSEDALALSVATRLEKILSAPEGSLKSGAAGFATLGLVASLGTEHDYIKLATKRMKKAEVCQKLPPIVLYHAQKQAFTQRSTEAVKNLLATTGAEIETVCIDNFSHLDIISAETSIPQLTRSLTYFYNGESPCRDQSEMEKEMESELEQLEQELLHLQEEAAAAEKQMEELPTVEYFETEQKEIGAEKQTLEDEATLLEDEIEILQTGLKLAYERAAKCHCLEEYVKDADIWVEECLAKDVDSEGQTAKRDSEERIMKHIMMLEQARHKQQRSLLELKDQIHQNSANLQVGHTRLPRHEVKGFEKVDTARKSGFGRLSTARTPKAASPKATDMQELNDDVTEELIALRMKSNKLGKDKADMQRELKQIKDRLKFDMKQLESDLHGFKSLIARDKRKVADLDHTNGTATATIEFLMGSLKVLTGKSFVEPGMGGSQSARSLASQLSSRRQITGKKE